MNLRIALFICIAIIISACTSKYKQENFSFFLSSPCMIVNTELSNSKEGTYLQVDSISTNGDIYCNIPDSITNKINVQSVWYVGWGNNRAYYNSGSENLRIISSIDVKNKKIICNKLIQGYGYPAIGQNIVLWNANPSGYKQHTKHPIISPRIWKNFKGESIHISKVVFSEKLQEWIVLANEVDTIGIQIYVASSKDLIHWKPLLEGNPFLQANDFTKCNWAGYSQNGKIHETPFVSDILLINNTWHIYAFGYNASGKKQIGLITTKDFTTQTTHIYPNAIIPNGIENTWNEQASFCPKISKNKNGYIMAFDGANKTTQESVGIAFSDNGIQWKQTTDNPVITDNIGWRSATNTTEPAYIETKNDTIFLMIAGSKKFTYKPHVFSKSLNTIGNVDKAQIGVYYSVSNGKTWIAHLANPIFINDFGNEFQNSHMGGNFTKIGTDTANIIIYQAKTNMHPVRYSIFLRYKKNN